MHPWIQPYYNSYYQNNSYNDANNRQLQTEQEQQCDPLQQQQSTTKLSLDAIQEPKVSHDPNLFTEGEQKLLHEHDEAIDAILQTQERIHQEWLSLRNLLRQSHLVDETMNDNHLINKVMISRRNIAVAFQLIFQQDLPDKKLDAFMNKFGSSDKNWVEETNFIVAVLNEEGFLFNTQLQNAVHAFDSKRKGLISTSMIERALQSYLLEHQSSSSASASPSTLSPERKLAIEKMLQQLSARRQQHGNAMRAEEMSMQQFVAILLEVSVPAQHHQQQEEPLTLPDDNSNQSPEDGQQQCVPTTTLSCSQSQTSVISDISQRPSILDTLSISLSPKDFIFQRPGRISHYYEFTDFVNRGSYGSIYFCKHRETGQERAVKMLRKSGTDDDYNQRIKNEFFTLRELDHPNILKQYELFEDENYYYIVMDAARGGDLCDELDQYGAFVEFEAARLMKQLLSCLAYLHSKGIVHCDVKPENIIQEATMELTQIKLIDFGFAAFVDERKGERLTTKQGTLYYSSPEVLKGNYSFKCDVWSTGVICFILLSDDFPFWGSSDEEIMQAIQEGNYSFSSNGWTDVSDLAKDFVSQLLTVDESKRPTAEQALQHPWIGQVVPEMVGQVTPFMLASTLNNLLNFSAQSKLKQAVCIWIASQILTKEDKEIVDKAFHIFDKNSRGSLKREEIRCALQEYASMDPTDEQLDNIFNRLDISKTGYIEYSEFVLAATGEEVLLSPQNLRKAFDCLDVDETGIVTKDNLRSLLGEALADWKEFEDEIVSQMIAQAGSNTESGITFEQFCILMES